MARILLPWEERPTDISGEASGDRVNLFPRKIPLRFATLRSAAIVARRYTEHPVRTHELGPARAGTGVAFTTSMLRQATAVFALSLLLPACDGDENTADKQSARDGWRSTQSALGSAGVGGTFTGSGTVSEDGTSGAVTGKIACEGGGSLDVAAAGEVTDERVAGSVSIEFDGCDVDGVIIDGSLDYSAEVTDEKVTGVIAGDLSFSGAASGNCIIDVAATVTKGGSAVGSASVSGSMCGYDYQDVFAD